jgi:hypothetical protein
MPLTSRPRTGPAKARARRRAYPLAFRPRVERLEARRLLSGGALAEYGQRPLSFEPNQGQADARAQFVSHGGGYALLLRPDEAVFAVRQSAAATVLDMRLVGANPNAQGSGLDLLPGVSNYLSGDAQQSLTNIPNFGQVEYHNVCPGIDLIYHGDQGRLEYDFALAPGADPGAITLSFQGAESINLDPSGNLVLHTAAGDVVEQSPNIYQSAGGGRQPVSGGYVLEGGDQVGFRVGPYDADLPLVIDPVFEYATYLGGKKNDLASAIAADERGDVYVTGTTESVGFPVEGNILQGLFNGAGNVAFVTVFNPQGQLVFSTYLGGNPDESHTYQVFDPFFGDLTLGQQVAQTEGTAIAVDPQGNVYVAGTSLQVSRPGSLDTTLPFPKASDNPLAKYGLFNAFVVKLDPTGSSMLYGTLVNTDQIGNLPTGLAVDAAGNAYVAGTSFDADNTSTTSFAGSVDPVFHAYAARLDPRGQLAYLTHLGGSGDEFSSGIAVDSHGNAYVAGRTNSPDFATQAPAANGPDVYRGTDGFVARLDPTGKPAYALRLGGDGDDSANGIALDAAGNIYVAGGTQSDDFPTVSPLQPKLAGSGNAFVIKLTNDGSTVIYSTYLGGSGADVADGIAVDRDGNAYVTGTTTSADFPVVNAFQPALGGIKNAFVAKLSADGSALLYSSYLGGGGPDEPGGIAVDGSGGAYVAGITGSTNLPTSPPPGPFRQGPVYKTYPVLAPFQKNFGGGSGDPLVAGFASDGFVARIAGGLTVTALPVRAVKDVVFSGPVATFTAPDLYADSATFIVTINWGDGNSSPATAITQPGGPGTPYQVAGTHAWTRAGSYPVVVTVEDSGENLTATTTTDVSQLVGTQAETTIAVNPADPSEAFVASVDEQGVERSKAGTGSGLFAGVSSDGGVTWMPADLRDQRIADGDDGLPPGGGDPNAVFDRFGNLFLTYLGPPVDGEPRTVAVVLSDDGGRTFRSLFTFTDSTLSLDQPKLAVGPGDQPGTGSVWLSFTGGGDGDERVFVGGARVTGPGAVAPFQTLVTVNGPRNGLLSDVAVGPQGQVLVSWKDAVTDGSPFSQAVLVNANPDGLKDLGGFAPTPTVAAHPQLARTGVPIPPQNVRGIDSNPRLAWDRSGGLHNGRVYLSYTGSNPTTTKTDIFLTHSDDNGVTWSPPVRVNGDTGPAFRFFPSLDVDQRTGDVAVGWYDTRDDPNNARTEFFTAVSGDGGQTFSPAVPVSAGPSDATYSGSANPATAPVVSLTEFGHNFQYGDYTGTAIANGVLLSAWADNSTALEEENPDWPQMDVAASRVAVAHVAVPPPLVVGQPLSTSEGGTFQGVVATFTDADTSLQSTDFSATINWGDGGSSDGTVTASGDANNTFLVRGTHRYAEEGAFPVVVTVRDLRNGLVATTASNVSQMPGYQGEGTVAVNPLNPQQLFAASNAQGRVGLFVATSGDGGVTWEGRTLPAGGGPVFSDPKAAFDQYGNLFLTLAGGAGNAIILLLSTDAGASFTPLATFTDPKAIDQPSLAVGPGPGGRGGSLWVSYESDTPGPTISAAGAAVTGLGQVGPFTVSHVAPGQPGSATRNFGDIAIGPSGQVLVDYQEPTLGPGPSTVFASLNPTGALSGGFGPPVPVIGINVAGFDRIPPEAVRSVAAEANLAWDRSGGPHNGRLYLAYTDAPAVGSQDTNIFVRHSDDNGATWSNPVRVNDDATANSQFLPSVAVDQATGQLAVAWYDARNDPADVKTEFFAAVSSDGGQTFSANVPVSIGTSDATDPGLNRAGRGNQYGDYTGLAFAQGVLYPVWTDNSPALGGNPDLPNFDLAAARVHVAQVADLPLMAQAIDIAVQEGQHVSNNLARFTDADPAGTVGDYTATINWGDNTPSSTGTIQADGNGGFLVHGEHTYAEEGTYPLSIVIADGGTSTTVSNNVVVRDAGLRATSRDLKPVEGQFFTGPVASFTDGDPAGVITDYFTSIDWRDGQSTPGTITYSGSAGLTLDPALDVFFAVGNLFDAKNPSNPDNGLPYLFSITRQGTVTPLFKLGAGFDGGLAYDTAHNRLYAIGTDAGGASAFYRLDPFFGLVSLFTLGSGFHDGLAFNPADGDFYTIATDASGASTLYRIGLDGTVTALFGVGNRRYSGLTFDTQDQHLYALSSDGDGLSSLYRIDLGGTVTQQFVVGLGFSGGLAFDRNDQNFYAINGSATGDSSFFQISPNGPSAALFLVQGLWSNGFDVIGTRTYADEGVSAVTVSIKDVGGATATGLSTATVVDVTPQGLPSSPPALVLQGLPAGSVALASFTVPGGLETRSGEYSATINWGDGSPIDTAAQMSVAGSTITVSGNHTYTVAGPAAYSVTLTDDTGNSAVAGGTINVAPDVSGQVRVVGVGGPRNPSTALFDDVASITNLTGADIPGPLYLVITGLPAGVTLANASGSTAAGDPFLTLNVQRLLHDQTLAPVDFQFSDPQLVPFSYHVTTFDGPPDGGPATGAPLDALPLGFEANRGQTDPQVQFVSRGDGYGVFLTAGEAVLSLLGSQAGAAAVLHLQLVGANLAPAVVGLDPLPGTANYLLGNYPGRWHTAIPTYARVEYQGVYPGINLDYHGTQRQLEYDFTLAPGANPGQIALTVQGADGLSLDAAGNLVLHTAGGDVVEHAPVIYQESDGVRRLISGGYVLLGPDRVGFRVGPYDRSRPLVIDPVLVYSTFLGGSSFDAGNGIAVDAADNVYVTGRTVSADFPTVNSAQATFGGAFVAKLDPTGSTLLYSTYLGDDASGSAIAVDSAGNAYVTGVTLSGDFPTVNAVQSDFRIGNGDAFVAKLDPTGSRLVFSTDLGGDGNTQGTAIAVDAAGNAYVTGATSASIGFPLLNALRPAFRSQGSSPGFPGESAFVTKLSPAGALLYSTYLGGSNDDRAAGIAVDGAGAAYVTGTALSDDFPTTAGAFQPRPGSRTAFATHDGGATWADTGLDAPVGLLVIDPRRPATLYAASRVVLDAASAVPTSRGLFKSTDRGATWAPINTGLSDLAVQALAIDPVHDSTLYAGTANGLVWKTIDGGGHWTFSGVGLPTFAAEVAALAIDPVTPSTVYATEGAGVFKSTDGGATWSHAGLSIPAGPLVIDPRAPTTLYASTADGVFKSTDGGADWTASNTGLPSPPSLTTLALSPSDPSVLYAGTRGSGVFTSTDGGGHWSPVNNGLPGSPGGAAFAEIGALAVDSSTPGTVYTAFDSTINDVTLPGAVFKSTNGGQSWAVVSSGLPPGSLVTTLALDPSDPSILYAGRSVQDPDVFVAKLAPSGSSLVYSTYLGGTKAETAGGIAVDAAGDAYVAGSTTSVDFPTANPLQPANRGGSGGNAFVVKLNAAGSALVYSTYLGGSGTDAASAIALDSAGNAYVTGQTTSADFPTVNALQPTYGGGAHDAFVTRLNAAGTALDYATYLGGRDDDVGQGIAVDAAGKAYVTGSTASFDFPTAHALQPVLDCSDAFITKIAPAGSGTLQIANVPAQAVEGQAFTGPVATFSDTDTDAAGSFTATIDWGDGTTSDGTVTANAAGGFIVSGTHTYSEDGFSPVSVTVRDADGTTATADATAALTNPAGFVAYHVTVDTSSLRGTSGFLDFQFNPGAVPGTQAATLSVSGLPGGPLALTNTGPLNEAKVPFTYGSDLSFDVRITGDAVTFPHSGPFGSTFALQLLGADSATPQATIDPGGAVLRLAVNPDGTTTATTFTAGDRVAAAVLATVTDAPLQATLVPVHATEGAPFSGPVATLSDANPSASTSDFAAVIDWGDGTPTDTGSVAPDGKGGFIVRGSHTYTSEGSPSLTVTIRDRGGSVVVARQAARRSSGPQAALANMIGQFPSSVAVGDFRHDGKLDMAVADESGVSVLLGNGDGTFGPAVTYAVDSRATFGPAFVLVADVNGDGKPDLVTANPDSNTVSVLLGNGDGTFQPARNFAAGSVPVSLAAADFNGDGKLDLVVGHGAGPSGASASISVLLGNGDGTFQTPVSYTTAADPVSVAVGDFNGDGKADIVSANAIDHNYSILLGNGDGTFQPARTTHVTAGAGAVVVGDFTGDGKADLAMASGNGVSVSVLPGNGDGTFGSPVVYPVGPGVQGLAVGDFRHDGKLDLAAANSNGLALLLGNGDGTFQNAVNYAAGINLSSVAVGDFNGDGHLDAAVIAPGNVNVPGSGSVNVVLGDGDGTLAAASVLPLPAGSRPNAVTAGDFSGDGKLDLAVASQVTNFETFASYGSASVLRNNGDGTFQAASSYVVGHFPRQVAAADINGDGKLDLEVLDSGTFNGVTANYSVLLGNGDGTFQAPTNFATNGAVDPTFLAVGDFNGDGIPDLLLDPTFFSGGQVFLGNGDGTFRPGPDVPSFVAFAAVADLNRDGKLDILTVNPGAPFVQPPVAPSVGVMLGKGNGTFQPAVSYAIPQGDTTDAPPQVVVGDFNGDGIPDLAVTIPGRPGSPQLVGNEVSILLGKGDGTFQPAVTYPSGGADATSAAAVDLNGDGKLDLVIVNKVSSSVSVLYGNGDGTFAMPVTYAVGRSPTAVAVADFDNDGTPDLAVTSALDGSVTLIRNLAAAPGVSVADAPLSATGVTLHSTSGTPFQSVVATFSDADPNGVPADYTATISWGDGHTSAGTVSADPLVAGRFDVTGGNTYATTGTYPLSVTIQDAGGSRVTSGGSATVVTGPDAPLTATGVTLNATAGVPFTGTVATFTDADPTGTASDYTAAITWGDGHTSAGTIQTNGGGGFAVVGANTYAEAGTEPITVTITDVGGATATALSTALVAASTDAPLTATAAAVQPVEGLPFTGTVAIFTDADPSAVVGDYTATISWGDGHTSAGTVRTDPQVAGQFDVIGSNTYVEEGSVPLTVIINDQGGASAMVPGTAQVGNAPLATTPVLVRAVEGQPFSGVVATFTDADPGGTAADYAATITWGDGHTSAGAVGADPLIAGQFDVTGGNTYAEAGTFPVTVALVDGSGPPVTVEGTALVADAALTAQAATINATENVPFGGPVATFTDADSGTDPGIYTARIFWGDGTSTDGSVQPGAGGGFSVIGRHTYRHGGQSYPVAVVVMDRDGATTTAQATAQVADAPLQLVAAAAGAIEGVPFTGALATFTDADPAAQAGNFTAFVTWADSGTTRATVAADPDVPRQFDVIGSNTFAEEGPSNYTVLVSDIGGARATVTGQVTVTDAALSAAAHPVQATEGSPFAGVVATFTDADPGGSANDYTATITWGDGRTSAGTVSADPQVAGQFDVNGSNTYAEEGTFPVGVTITDGAGPVTVSTTAQVGDAALTGQGVLVSAAPGRAFTGLVATFTDANPGATAGDFTATIVWDDGQVSGGPVTADPAIAGQFDVIGSNTYDTAGTYPMTVGVVDSGGATLTLGTEVQVAAATGLPLRAFGGSVILVENVPFTGVLASFRDDSGGAADYSVTITGPDGRQMPAVVVPDATWPGQFDVLASVTSGQVTSFPVTVAVTRNNRPAATAPTLVRVLDAALQATGLPAEANEGAPATVSVARFTDGDPAARPGHYAVTIDWGDGRTSGGRVRLDGQGGFDVVGSHTYAERGGYVVAVAIEDPNGAAATAQGFIDVGGPTEGGPVPAPANAPPARAMSDLALASLARILAEGLAGADSARAADVPGLFIRAEESATAPATSFALPASLLAFFAARDTQEMTGEIRGTVVEDGADRSPLAGVIVYLDQNDNGQVDEGERTTRTDARGEYRFDNLPLGRYTVRVVVPPGRCLTRPEESAYRVELKDVARIVVGLDFRVARSRQRAGSLRRTDPPPAGVASPVTDAGPTATGDGTGQVHDPEDLASGKVLRDASGKAPAVWRLTDWWRWLVSATVLSAGYCLLAGRRVRSGEKVTRVPEHPIQTK